MIEFLPEIVYLGLLVFCLIDCIQTPADECRNLAKALWILLIVIVPIVGGVAWLVAGRPVHQATGHWAPGNGFAETSRPARDSSEIDDRLTADLRRVDDEHAEMLRRWEADLQAREERTTKPSEPPEDATDSTS